MSQSNTVLSQLLKFVSRHEFEQLANQHRSGHSFRTASRWSQFVSPFVARLSGRKNLRDIFENMSAQAHRRCHLGNAKSTRSHLSRSNENKPYQLYEDLFARLLKRC